MANPGQSVITIYPDRLTDNWRWLDSQTASDCRTASVVKADAYGLGLAGIAPILRKAGCTDFCVAQLAEGIALRQLLPDVSIQVLEGLLPGTEADYAAHQLTATLNNESQIARASSLQETSPAPPPWLHIDTGMARLGLADLPTSLPDGLQLAGVMSHLAC
ncbi:MAG: alanine racemase, partial [Alphaproteobacteria bacterium]|nr:alanine racemase [Alphaproteobacteria bacterium]